MRFAIQPTPQLRTWEQIREFHLAADRFPIIESVWSADHFEPSGFAADGTPIGFDGPQLEAWTLTAAVAEATTRVRLGPLVTCVAYRNPGLFANMVSMADIVSGGRIELGLGSGWNVDEARRYGIELGAVSERMDRFGEALEILHSLFTQDRTDFDGRYFTLNGAHINPKPVQQPHPPFVIGGTGERRTIPLVAKWAQHWNVGPINREVFRAKRRLLDEECEKIGRDARSIAVSCNVTLRPDSDLSVLADKAMSYEELGIDLVIVMLADPVLTPAVVEPLAKALEVAAGQ